MAESVADVYAESLFELANEAGNLSDTAKELTEIGVVLSGYPELTKLLSLPTITADEKCDIIKNVFGGRISELSEHFLAVLATKKRMSYYDKIAVDFHNRFNKAQGQLDVMVTSPVALSDSQATALKDKLGSKYNRTIVLHFKLDPTLMGGMIVDVGGRTYDGSVKTKLDTIKQMVESATA